MSDAPQPASAETTALAPHPITRLKAGDTLIGRFVIVRYLAHGGMGEVYEAADQHLQGKHHALKTLRPDVADKPGFRQRFEREVLLARDINHPNVCPTYDLFQVQDERGPLTFLTMKLLHGESLQVRLRREGRLSSDVALPIAREMAGGLDAAHQRGVVHRDFKPGNVMLEPEGAGVHVWITDFGLSRAFGVDTTLADSGQLLGTPGYIAPEVLHGGVASYAADVYAFGVVLYDMLTGQRPAPAGDLVPPSRLVPDIPAIWDRVVLGCLEPDPTRRFQSAGQAMALLGPASAATTRTAPRARGWAGPLKWLAGAAAITLLTAAAIVFGRPLADDFLHPLPDKRFVALMAWPASTDANARLVNRVTAALGSRLARAEAATKDLMVISANDVGSQSSLKAPTDAGRVLGANLVLATSVVEDASGVHLVLSLLDATNAREIRRRTPVVPAERVARIEDVAAASAAELLHVRLPAARWKDQDELASMSRDVFQRFSAAEELADRPNDAGLDAAIQEYQRVVDATPTFALAYARLSLAYSRKFTITQDRAALSLASRNADVALQLNADSVNAVLSRAMVDLYSGHADVALDALGRALQLDPGNPQILLAEARAYRARNAAAEEERTYRAIIASRPNFWPAYEQLGLYLYRHADYAAAAEAFREALVVAPGIVRLLNNLGAMQMFLKQRAEAADTYRRSVAITPTATAYMNLGTLAFMARDYPTALAHYERSSEISPKDDLVWRNIGDTYTMLRDAARVRENYAHAAEVVSSALKTNPNRGDAWMNLALYEAKLGHDADARAAIQRSEDLGAATMPVRFKKAQTLNLLGRKEEALSLLVDCVQKGLSLEDVDLAVDLAELCRDPRYQQAAAAVRSAGSERR